MNINNYNFILLSLFFSLIIFALYLSYIGGYGSDEDTLPMIGVFEALLNSGGLMTSRFTGYPVAEIGIGFLSYHFGSFIANITTFFLFIGSLYFLFKTFSEKELKYEKLLFLILCLSNPVLFFDNIEPIDYSWSLAPFSFGCYMFKKKRIELALLFFAIAIGARLNFGLFIIFFVLFFENEQKTKLINKIYFIFSCLFLGSLFYLPVWYQFKFGFDWLTAARPNEQGFIGLIARFTYKLINIITPLSFILIIYSFAVKNYFSKIKDKNIKTIFYIILSNLLLFLWIPSDLSYLQLGIILFYLFILKNFKKKIILLLIFLNFTTWAFQVDFLNIIYKDKENKCSPSHAVDAKINPHIKEGAIQQYLENREMIKCWIDLETKRGKKILEGKALK